MNRQHCGLVVGDHQVSLLIKYKTKAESGQKLNLVKLNSTVV